MKNGKFEAADIYNLLAARFAESREWVCAREVSNATGYHAVRRLDFVAANCFESKGLGVHAFEVKISKSDLRRELQDSEKHTIFYDDIDTFSIVAPDYVLDAEYRKLIPVRCGIYVAVATPDETFEGGFRTELKTVRKPLELHDEKERRMSRGFAMSLLRAMVTQDAKCHPKDDLQRRYEEGYEYGLEIAGRRNADYKRLYDESAYARELAEALQVRDAERAKKVTPLLKAALEMKWDLEWVDRNVNTLVMSAEKLRKQFGEISAYAIGEASKKTEVQG